MTTSYTNTLCVSHNRCKKYRECDICNNIRKARYCDITMLASRFSPHASYAVVMPHAEAQSPILVNQLKTKITRKLRRSTNGIFCAIETSANDALHLNMILTHSEPLSVNVMESTLKDMGIGGDILLQSVPKKDIPKITAYSLKRQSLPAKSRYGGNLVNTAGDIRQAGEIMQSRMMLRYAPVIVIEAMVVKLNRMGIKTPMRKTLEGNYIQHRLTQLVDMVNQVDKFGHCYSSERGLLTKDEFETLYHREMKKAIRLGKKNKKENMTLVEYQIPDCID